MPLMHFIKKKHYNKMGYDQMDTWWICDYILKQKKR
ncbi:hypothetical protein RDI58_021649 [Solanum bulbocastanum]|uniref:Uncharacterized protein n=1 Tax=Solanum bulbocastanum TaxID=147425 RepID=A0AAN8T0P1_SOLBU